jgi:hypothetical protein
VDEIRGFRPGTPVPLGDSPPAEGALGFVTGARYASGALVDDREGGGVGDDGYLFAGMSEGTP